MSLTATDLFCGAGGSSLGASVAGVELAMAANHWQTAIDVHQAHFPDAAHDCADISQTDPRRYPRTDLLLASPECFTAGHLVTTSDGQVPIEDVRVGALVLTHLGNWKPVVRTQKRHQATVIVKGQGHTGIECTETHQFWSRLTGRRWNNAVRDYRRFYNEPGWWEARAMTSHMWATPTQIKPIVNIEPPAIFGNDPTAAWWLVGRWLGDGSMQRSRNEVVLTCGFHEAELIRERLADTQMIWRERDMRTATEFVISDKVAAEWLWRWCGEGGAGKEVPTAALSLARARREALLDGYLSADGSYKQRRVRCSTISRKLAISVRLLAESLGHRVAMAHDKRTTYSIEGRTGTAKLQWILHWEPRLSAKRQPEAFVEDGLAWSRVRSVTPASGGTDVFNIEVADDHSYVLDGIVVKNCTNHSQARGISRKRQDPSLWDAPDPSAERSRATMWDVPKFAEQMKYRAIVVENVVEATKWVGWRGWHQAIADIGYSHRVLSVNSQDHRVPQSRDRIYVVFWLGDLPGLDLELERTAHCGRCERVRPCRQAWKNGRTVGRYRQQWIWSCATCTTPVDPDRRPADDIIDWSLACPRIGDRARPLAAATRKRILAGLQRYGYAPIVTKGAGNAYETTPGNRARPLTEPLPTQGTSAEHALVVPLRRNGHCSRTSDVLPTVTASGTHHGLLMRNNNGGAEMCTPTSEPARTMTTTGHQSLLLPYYSNSQAQPTTRPVPTVTTKDRCAVIDPEQYVDDCGFRMLEPHEIAAAMAFPDGYIPSDLTKRDRVKLAGNAVTPPVMTHIVGRLAAALEAS